MIEFLVGLVIVLVLMAIVWKVVLWLKLPPLITQIVGLVILLVFLLWALRNFGAFR